MKRSQTSEHEPGESGAEARRRYHRDNLVAAIFLLKKIEIEIPDYRTASAGRLRKWIGLSISAAWRHAALSRILLDRVAGTG